MKCPHCGKALPSDMDPKGPNALYFQTEKPKCETCGGTGQTDDPQAGNSHMLTSMPCPDCQPPYPDAGEFQKELEAFILMRLINAEENNIMQDANRARKAEVALRKLVRYIDCLETEFLQLRNCFGFNIRKDETLFEGFSRNYAEFDDMRKKLNAEIERLEAKHKKHLSPD